MLKKLIAAKCHKYKVTAGKDHTVAKTSISRNDHNFFKYQRLFEWSLQKDHRLFEWSLQKDHRLFEWSLQKNQRLFEWSLQKWSEI